MFHLKLNINHADLNTAAGNNGPSSLRQVLCVSVCVKEQLRCETQAGRSWRGWAGAVGT